MQSYEMLESELAQWIGTNDVVVCSSGTAALHIAIESFGIPLGREVIIPNYSMIACALSVSMGGMIPVCVGRRSKDLLIDTDLIEESITDNTRMILAVHNYARIVTGKQIGRAHV